MKEVLFCTQVDGTEKKNCAAFWETLENKAGVREIRMFCFYGHTEWWKNGVTDTYVLWNVFKMYGDVYVCFRFFRGAYKQSSPCEDKRRWLMSNLVKRFRGVSEGCVKGVLVRKSVKGLYDKVSQSSERHCQPSIGWYPLYCADTWSRVSVRDSQTFSLYQRTVRLKNVNVMKTSLATFVTSNTVEPVSGQG